MELSKRFIFFLSGRQWSSSNCLLILFLSLLDVGDGWSRWFHRWLLRLAVDGFRQPEPVENLTLLLSTSGSSWWDFCRRSGRTTLWTSAYFSQTSAEWLWRRCWLWRWLAGTISESFHPFQFIRRISQKQILPTSRPIQISTLSYFFHIFKQKKKKKEKKAKTYLISHFYPKKVVKWLIKSRNKHGFNIYQGSIIVI